MSFMGAAGQPDRAIFLEGGLVFGSNLDETIAHQ
jgi:hypothetical protein